MGRLGTALTLVTREDYQMVRTIERVTGQNFERREVEGQLKALICGKNEKDLKFTVIPYWCGCIYKFIICSRSVAP